MNISVMLSNLKLPFEEALDAAVQMQIPAVQLSVSASDDATALRAMKNAVAARGLAVSAICVDAGDLGETDSDKPLVENLKPLMNAAVEMQAWSTPGAHTPDGYQSKTPRAICQTHVGIMPYTMSGARWNSFVKSCRALAEHGDEIGATLAMETGPEPPRVMEALLKEVGSAGLSVNYDPANFIIWPGMLSRDAAFESKTETPLKPYDKEEALREFEPVEGVLRLAPNIVHTHAKDARGNESWGDVPLGEGWVDWPRYLRLLKENGFDGYLAIEREAGEDRIGEIGRAAEFLRGQLSALEGEQ